ncbi:MAG: ChrR family anti-sigma-E factor [Geminicoccaceae bacterium]
MTPRHHLPDDLLAGYAAGSIDEALSLLVATHVSMCATCRARLAAFEALGGSMLDALEGIAVSQESFQRVNARLCACEPMSVQAVSATSKACSSSGLPATLDAYLPADGTGPVWRNVVPGVQTMRLKVGTGETILRLLKIRGGMAVPDHSHHGDETTLVLRGSFSDRGERFLPGDVVVNADDDLHSPVIDEGEDCICLVATEAPLAFKNPVHRAFNLFARL